MVAKKKDEAQPEAPDIALSFFKKVLPFKNLDEEILIDLTRHCRVDFYPKGTRILTAGETEITDLFLIQKGGVRSFITDQQGSVALKDYRGEGSYIGALGIIRGARASLDIETVEDTFCLLLPRKIFLELIEKYQSFSHYYLKSFSDKIVNTAYSELRNNKLCRRAGDDLYLFSVTVGEVVKNAPRRIDVTATIQEAAAKMVKYRVGSLLIYNPEEPDQVEGMITDRDLRSRVVAAGKDYNEPVASIMSSPVETVLSQSVCFDVLLKMMSTGIHHLAVERSGKIVGVITSHDIMTLQGSSPYYLFKDIVNQQKISGLYPLAQNVPDVIRNLIKEGGKAGNITRMIAILNDHVLDRLLTLLEQELGPPPVSYCWLLMGSEGRREQTFKTDQDNAIIYADPENEELAGEAKTYFKEFADKAIGHLVNCGYPLCPGEIMATNPRWCQPASVWKEYFDTWVAAPDPKQLLNATIFFDFRAGFGDEKLARNLRIHLMDNTVKQDIFLFHLARHALSNRIPISFFRNFIVEKDGKHRNKLDIKYKGIAPFSDFARILSLKYGVRETNTLARLNVLINEEHIAEDLGRAACEAYELLMQFRLIHQLEQLENGVHPDNYIDPAHITELERKMLKEAFGVIERLHSVLDTMFPAG